MSKLKFVGMSLITALAVSLVACGDDSIPKGTANEGCLRPLVDLNTSVLSSRDASSRADASAVSVNDIVLTLVSTDGTKSYDLGTVGSYDASKRFPIGTYTLVASYGAPDDEGFDMPYYYGESEVIRVQEGETTEVAVTAALANSMFSVAYTDNLKKYLVSYSAELQSEGSASPLEYAADETRPIHVKSGNVDVFVNIEKNNGTKARLKAATVKAEPRYHYSMSIDINEGNVGDGTLTVTFSDDLTDEDVNIDLGDEIINASAPEVTASATNAVKYIATTTNDTEVKYNIIARGLLAGVTLNTTNASAIDKNWPESVDLMKLTDAQKSLMTGLGLNCLGLWSNPDKMAIVDLTKVVSNITGSEDVSFSLTVTDKANKTSDPSVMTIDVEPLTLEISNFSALMVGRTSLDFDLVYNAGNPADNIIYIYKNNRGTLTEISATSCVAAAADDTYKVTLTVPDTDNFVFYASNKAKTANTDEMTVTRVAPPFAVNVYDAFATYAFIDAVDTDTNASLNKYATVYLSTDDSNYNKVTYTTDAAGHIKLTGLTGSTTYYAKVSVTGSVDDAVKANFTTEAATALDNGDMETWSTGAGTSYWSVEYPGSDANTPWGTMNLLTTSDGSSKVPGLLAYIAYSGTRKSTDKHGGSAAAIVETIGWGAGNTATGSSATGICKNITPGELYLGSYSDGAQYGIDFASRPQSLTFWYKYAAKNSADYGVAEIKVLAADGSVIASVSKNITNTSSYTKETLNLSYASTTKAAKIQVNFKSSGNSDCWTKNKDNLTPPGFSAAAEHYHGSALYIDDITLNY